LRDKGGDIAIPFGLFVDRAVVLDRLKLSVLLFDKEEVCGVGAPGFVDCPSL